MRQNVPKSGTKSATGSYELALAVLASTGVKPEIKAEAKERQRWHGGTAPGRRNSPGKLPQVKGRARDEVAKFTGVKPRTLEKAEASQGG